MSETAAVLALASGAVLLCAVTTLWRRALAGVIRTLALQGIALGAVAGALGERRHDEVLFATAVLIVGAKGVVIPALFRRVLAVDPASSETDPVVNVPASLVAAGALTFVAFATTRQIVAVAPAVGGPLLPFGFATVLIGFFVLVSRRKAVSQMVGLLQVDNGIGLVALLLTAGVPFLIEIGGSLDVLFVVVVLRVLAARMRAELGGLDLDALRELHD